MVSVGNACPSNYHLVEHLSAVGHNHCNRMSVQDSNTCVVNKLAFLTGLILGTVIAACTSCNMSNSPVNVKLASGQPEVNEYDMNMNEHEYDMYVPDNNIIIYYYYACSNYSSQFGEEYMKYLAMQEQYTDGSDYSTIIYSYLQLT